MTPLEERIVEKIGTDGPIPFMEFMEMCLYYPGLGFYTSPGSTIGRNGSFYTSSCLTPVFGAMIGRQLELMWKELGCGAFKVVEYGAGTGALCHDILSWLEGAHPEMYRSLSYGIIEKSPTLKKIAKSHLHEKVVWYDTIQDAGDIEGCVFSNELLDNFAVHQVVMADELMEVFVQYEEGFSEILLPASAPLKEYIKEHGILLPYGFRTEINLQAVQWLKEVCGSLRKGYVLTIDYGYVTADLYKPCRSNGTLLCYRDHSVNDAYYSHIGEQDITAHVNFSALGYWGEKLGLKQRLFTDQCHFLLSMGFTEFIQQAFSAESDILRAAKQIARINHVLLVEMGDKFKVLIQEKT